MNSSVVGVSPVLSDYLGASDLQHSASAHPAQPIIHPIVLSGGGGERLWPLSRAAFPKQLLEIADQPSLLERTVSRLSSVPALGRAPIGVICNEADRFFVAQHMSAAARTGSRILAEPDRRDSAAAIGLATCAAFEEDPDSLLLVCPADHLIEDFVGFSESILAAVPAAHEGRIVTFGVVPDRPHTGYGYLKRGVEIAGTAARELSAFIEKPDLSTAQRLIAEGNNYWNSGIFLFEAKVMRQAFLDHMPDTWSLLEETWKTARSEGQIVRFDPTAFRQIPKISIDYAIMEKASNLAVIEAKFDWNDVGLWPSIAELLQHDKSGNAHWGRTELVDTRNSFVYSNTDMLVATLGIEGLIITVTQDAILVCPKDRANDLKKLVEILKEKGVPEAEQHRTVFRPWGSFTTISRGPRYLVKRIRVAPGGLMSLQQHHHRAEHWVIVSGTARVEINGESQLLTENQSAFIPLGAIHRLENPGKIELEFIEVQSGSYLEDDDIIRIEDGYGRTQYPTKL